MQQNNSKQNPSNAEERHSVSLAVLNAQELTGRGRAAVIEALSRGSDYLVRVNMNSVLLQLDPNDAEDHKLAMDVLDELLADM